MSGAPRARLFVALDLPATVREELAAWGRQVGQEPLRPVPVAALHVTLCFLGWRDEGQAEEIAGLVLAAVPEATAAPRLGLSEAAWLPPRRPRVLAVDLADAGGVLGEVQGRVSDALAAGAGFEPEKRAFRPHVTVARVPRGARIQTRDQLPQPPPVEFGGAAVTLYRSRLSREGARYEALAHRDLEAR